MHLVYRQELSFVELQNWSDLINCTNARIDFSGPASHTYLILSLIFNIYAYLLDEKPYMQYVPEKFN